MECEDKRNNIFYTWIMTIDKMTRMKTDVKWSRLYFISSKNLVYPNLFTLFNTISMSCHFLQS